MTIYFLSIEVFIWNQGKKEKQKTIVLRDVIKIPCPNVWTEDDPDFNL